MDTSTYLLLDGGATRSIRPAPVRHAAIAPPFDQSDQYGNVPQSLPPEQVIPPHFEDPVWMRADFGGVNLNADRWGGIQRFKDAYLMGANTSPYTMILTPMLVMYPRWLQDATLTEHAERGYDNMIIDCEPWNCDRNGQSFTPSQMADWLRYVRSWGFRVVLWRGDPTRGIDPMFQTLMDGGLVSFYIHGEEVDSRLPASQYEASLQGIDRYVGGRIPIGVHFTADGSRHMGYPIGFPRDDYLRDWSPYDGRVHLCWQGDPTASAGLMGASIGHYARLHVNCGQGDAALGPGAPNSRVIAFELRATQQFYGSMTEEQGNLTTWEMLCAPRDSSKELPISGFGNGCRYPDGTPI